MLSGSSRDSCFVAKFASNELLDRSPSDDWHWGTQYLELRRVAAEATVCVERVSDVGVQVSGFGLRIGEVRFCDGAVTSCGIALAASGHFRVAVVELAGSRWWDTRDGHMVHAQKRPASCLSQNNCVQ